MSSSGGFVSVTVRCSGCNLRFTLRLLPHSDDLLPDRQPLCPSCLIDSDDDDDDDDDESPFSRTSSNVDSAVPTVLITEASLRCAICTEALDVGSFARRLPCLHMYHSECILPWLRNHNTCPLCRSSIVSGRGR